MIPLLRFLARRLGWAAIVIAGVGTLAFFTSRILPGDPARMLLGPQARAADAERARALYGLDRPATEQYLRFWTRMIHRGPALPARQPSPEHSSCAELVWGVHLDLGYSFHHRRPVVDLIAEMAPRSLELALAALLFQTLIGLGAGLVSARWRGTLWDQLSVGSTLVGLSAPTFLLGLVLQYVLAYKLGWLPYDGYGRTATEHLLCLVLPALTLGVYGAAIYARLSRDELSAVLASDHVRMARAKGASEPRVLVVHGLRSALLPLATLMVLDVGTLIGGAVVTERLFRWPGMGYLAVEALVNRDGPVVLGTVLFSAAAIVLAVLALDLLHVALDPRLRKMSRR